jgi:hypothetical protein
MRLCQRPAASCGACCGLYNRADPSRGPVAAELRRRSAALARAPRTAEAFRAAARVLDDAAPPALFPSVRVCPLLGFLGDGEGRIGCLAHPAATGGVDLRDCGAYDAGVCESFLCPSFSWLTEAEAEIAEAAAGDWHLYGLVVTDVPFLRAALEAVADGTGAAVERRHLDDARFRATLRRLLALKEELAPGSEGLFGAFAPGPDGEPLPRRIDYGALGRPASRYDAILTCVGADPRSGNDLDRLEEEVRRRLDACVAAFPTPPSAPPERGRGPG